jgi:UDP-N-acetylmuramoylalanine--D-glutamate ligase
MLSLDGKHLAVVGLGISGLAAARLAASRGASVTLNDSKPTLSAEAEREIDSIRSILHRRRTLTQVLGHHELDLRSFDVVVVSPGVPAFPALTRAEEGPAQVLGEVDFALQCLRVQPAHLIAVGGTNGKSTVTSLLGAFAEALSAAGVPGFETFFVGGNLGEPLSKHADEDFRTVILEVSSFQMERVLSFHPRVSVLLNVSDDHLDRYDGFDAYANAKGNAFLKQTHTDAAIVPEGDAVCAAQAKRGGGRMVSFGGSGAVQIVGEHIVDTRTNARLALSSLKLQGKHNALNVAAALAAIGDLGVPMQPVFEAARAFEGLAHRMALVAEIAGVRYYDDSKGTNVGASVTAIEGLSESKVVLIAGGKDKGGSYAPLASALARRGRAAVLVGESAQLIERALGDLVPTSVVSSMEEAVREAAQLARPGDAVLLSPACSSFDMFRDYKHRGGVFVLAVRALKGAK